MIKFKSEKLSFWNTSLTEKFDRNTIVCCPGNVKYREIETNFPRYSFFFSFNHLLCTYFKHILFENNRSVVIVTKLNFNSSYVMYNIWFSKQIHARLRKSNEYNIICRNFLLVKFNFHIKHKCGSLQLEIYWVNY